MLRGWKTWLLRLKEGDSLSTLYMWVGFEKKGVGGGGGGAGGGEDG